MTAVTAGTVTRVQVTADDIRNGSRGDCALCPIALALVRATAAAEIRVGGFRADIRIGGRVLTARLPQAARDFVSRFDGVLPVGPLEFDLTWEAAS